MKSLPIPADIAHFLSYDPATGAFYWLSQRAHGADISRPAGCRSSGYVVIKFRQRQYAAHRLAWFFIHGSDPGQSLVDHKNGDGLDNRAENLRLATLAENGWNAKRSGRYLKGVWFDPSGGRYWARIAVNGRAHRLGTFDTEHEAHAAYRDAAQRLHGEFARFE